MRAWLAALLVSGAASGATASELDAALFGADPGAARAAACFIRHYDDQHLAAHPEQNVTDMILLVDGQSQSGDRSYMSSLAVNFRGLETQMQVSGYCGAVEAEGQASLGCGIECDGGTIAVRMRDADTVLVDIPDGARTWDPTADLEADPSEIPAEAAFGPDDKTFRLERTALEHCLPLVYDDELKAMVSGNE